MFQIKCDNGKCYNNTLNNFDKTELCMSNQSFVGWYNPKYPSEDYWQLVKFF